MAKLSYEALEVLVEKRNNGGFEHTVEVMDNNELVAYRENCVEAIERQVIRIAKAKKGGVVQKSAIELKEQLEGYVAYIDAKLSEENEPKGEAAVIEFLNRWKNNVVGYFVELIEQYKEIEKMKLPRREIVLKRNSFLKELTKAEITKVVTYSNKSDYKDWVEADIIHEMERKHMMFMARITKKAGEIIDASGLHLGNSGEINGTVKGSKDTVDVTTISAGGYNVQCFHFRVLVK